jgi:Ca2+-binding RTX toxin-like protein
MPAISDGRDMHNRQGEHSMANFSVLNGTGIGGAGIQFGSLSQIASAGVAGFPIITPTTGSVFFNDTGLLSLAGTGMSFIFPSTFGGTVSSLTYSQPAVTPVFSITGMNTALADVASGFLTPGGELAALAIIFSGNDTITGSTLADKLIGFDGADNINGGTGDDVLRGGAGADILDGGDGSDFANYQGSAADVFVDLQSNLIFGGDATGDVLTNIENLYGSSGNDFLSGDAGHNIIGGENGADNIDGRAGDDVVSGEAGDDAIKGSDGSDRVVGGAGADLLHGDDGADLAGDGNDSIDGGTENDQIFGDGGNDSLYGGTGDDHLDGGDGNDVLIGAAGADTMDGGAGTDTVSYAGSAAGVTVSLAAGTGTGGDAQGDTLTGIENLYGSDHDDHLTGNAGANTISGGLGNDVITGGGGADLLKGGTGNDIFVYTSTADSTVAASGKDLIADFTSGDKIDLSAIDADGNAGNGDTAFSFGTGGFTGHAGEVRVVNFGNGVQGVYLDTNGDKVPESIINVISDHALTAADFVL